MEKVKLEFNRLKHLWEGVIPYVFLQAYLSNRMQYHIVCLNGVALYEAKINKSKGKNPKVFLDAKGRAALAEKVIITLKASRPESLLDYLVRVDLMECKYLNKVIVNELESLEAGHYANYYDNYIYEQLHTYLGYYYANKILLCLRKCLNTDIPLFTYPSVDKSKSIS